MVIIRNNISLLIWCIALLLSPVGTVRERERERERERHLALEQKERGIWEATAASSGFF
jgi:hypothetical protein